MALAILGMPVDKIGTDTIRQILAGGTSICAEAGIPVAGGHSIDCPEPVYGLAVIGTCPKAHVRRNSGARPGDRLILTKRLGVGIYSSAFRRGRLSASAYDELIASTTRLNRVGMQLAADPGVHAITDVTGFGILGHALEMARGSGVGIRIDHTALPFLTEAPALSTQGFVTGASHRNWASYGGSVVLPATFGEADRHLLTDPQTSGGLLVACAPERVREFVGVIEAGGDIAALIGRVEAGEPAVTVEA